MIDGLSRGIANCSFLEAGHLVAKYLRAVRAFEVLESVDSLDGNDLIVLGLVAALLGFGHVTSRILLALFKELRGFFVGFVDALEVFSERALTLAQAFYYCSHA